MGFFKLIVFISFTLIIGSCSDDECRTETDVQLYALLSTKTDSIWIKATDTDSILYDNVKAIQLAKLPLKKFENLSEYIFRINSIADTIKIYHQNYTYLIDYTCGCVIYHTIDSILFSNNQIDSINLINASVTNAGEENIEIYY